MRDAVLAVSGELNQRMGGPSFRDFQLGPEADNISYTLGDAFGPATNRRSVYRTVVRAAAYPLLETLDCADPAVSTPRRSVTTTPLQALSLLNNRFMRQAAAAHGPARRAGGRRRSRSADRAGLSTGASAGGPTPSRSSSWPGSFAAEFGLAEFCLVIFNSNEFLYVD